MKHTLLFLNRRLLSGLILGVLAVTFSVFFFKTKSAVQKQFPQVTVAAAIKKSVPLEVRVPGLTQSQEAIQIRSRIDGVLKEIHFQEGQIVKENDLLFTFDDEAIQAQLRQAEANLSKNMALFEDAKIEVKRNQPLLKKGFVTNSAFDQLQANMKSLEGTTKADQAAIDLLKVQLGYTKIHSPITGLVGFHKVLLGNYVRTEENTPLVSVVKVDPLEALFNLPERYLPRLLSQDSSKIGVQLLTMNGDLLSQKASLFAFDNEVKSNAGIIPIKVKIENHVVNGKPALLPGQYVISLLQLGMEENALVVPLSAIQNGQNGSYVFVYNAEDHTVHYRSVKLGLTTNTEAIVTDGLRENEKVVASGQIRLSDKIKVSVMP
ncbi:MAG: efflux RND transporter periplasmic adaptor subunit [Alphaproteobacteria bacterium]|nr:efflux RND transporter periplasmic adaptor subunit [Alphaproteobacteria bacterium]